VHERVHQKPLPIGGDDVLSSQDRSRDRANASGKKRHGCANLHGLAPASDVDEGSHQRSIEGAM
jgi:hypothetical protein